jgi:hypothetical protein
LGNNSFGITTEWRHGTEKPNRCGAFDPVTLRKTDWSEKSMPRRRAFRPALSNVLEGRIALSSAAAGVGHQSSVVAAETQAASTATIES